LDIWFELDKKYIFEAIIGQELGLYSVGGRTSARGKGLTRTSLGYREAATSKRICKYKAITKELKHARTKCNYKAKAKRKLVTDIVGGRTSAIRKRPYTNVYQGE